MNQRTSSRSGLIIDGFNSLYIIENKLNYTTFLPIKTLFPVFYPLICRNLSFTINSRFEKHLYAPLVSLNSLLFVYPLFVNNISVFYTLFKKNTLKCMA